jgi:hypothetical protein
VRCAVGSALVAVLLGGCDHRCGPDGQWTDVATRRGAYDGYEVSACATAEVSVLGDGSRWAGDAAPGAVGRDQAFVDFADLVAVKLTVGHKAFVDPGPRAGCTNPEAVVIQLNNWADVDPVVMTVGQLLKQGSLREEVLIQIESVPRYCPSY